MSTQDIQFNKNEDLNKQDWDLVKSRLEKIYGGGGEKASAKQKEKGKMLCRERVDYLRDPNTVDVWVVVWLLALDMYRASNV